MKKYISSPIYAIVIAMFCSILWGSAFPALKISYTELGIAPNDIYARIVFAGMRFLLASIFIFMIIKFVIKITLKISDKKIWMQIFLIGILQTTLQYFFFYNGLAHTSGAKSAIISASGTFFVILLAHFVYHDDRMNWKKAIGLVLGFVGIVFINFGKQGFDYSFTIYGEGFLILASLSGAFANILVKKVAKNVHPFLLTAWQMLMGSILLLGLGLSGLQPNAMAITAKSGLLLVYLAILSATAFSLWNSLLKYHKAGEISLFKFMVPVSGAILSVIFISGETFSVKFLVALILVAAGIVVVYYPSNS